MRKLALAIGLALIALAAFAQASTAAAPTAPSFQAGLNLGTDVIVDQATGNEDNWTKLAFQPDIAFGKFGIGVDFTIHFQLYKTQDEPLRVYGGDWVPNYEGNGKTFFDVYLPKFLYVRYGLKGEDPLYVKLGSIRDMSLGNGFVLGEYSNMCFMPTTRMFGMEFGLDGALFNFPLVGLQLAAGNLARLDVIGGRLYARPFMTTSIPILKNSEVGLTLVADNDPYRFIGKTGDKPISVFGIDAMAPLVTNKLFPVAAFADIAFEPNKSFGAMLGFGGKLFALVNWGAQLRILQDGFIPAYFDANYDLYRALKYDFMQEAAGKDVYAAWYASLGFSLIENKIVFNARLDGPFKAADKTSANQADFPHFKAIATLAEGILGGFSIDASWEKYFLGKTTGFFPDLVDPLDAVIGMAINYHTGAAVLTLNYNAKYDPTIQSADFAQKFVVTSSISATMKF